MRYQLTCPKCKHEFAYNNGHIDSEIATVKDRVAKVEKLLAEYKLLPYEEQMRKKAYRKRLAAEKLELCQKLQALKSFRKHANEERRRTIDSAFNQLVKEEIGEKEYKRLREKAEAECEAYNICDMMKHEYTRANYKTDVTSINKL